VFTQDTVNLIAVTDIDALERIARVFADFGQGLKIAGISQLIDVNDSVSGVGDDMTDDRRANKPGAAGN
jgi:hypothetical protein